jgi:hypothetical protein
MCGITRAGLIPCPDCEHHVSKRAVFCPQCGCPPEAIAEAAKALKEPEPPKPPVETLLAISDRGSFFLYPAVWDNRHYLVGDLAALEGVQTLLVSNVTHQLEVSYRAPKLACDEPLVFFETEPATNILFRAEIDVPTKWGAERTLRLTAPPQWQALSPKRLRQQGQAWREGIRDATHFTHPFYLLQLTREEATP